LLINTGVVQLIIMKKIPYRSSNNFQKSGKSKNQNFLRQL
jgi:hypothetical protein